MKQSAVEWLVEQMKINNYISDNAHWLIDDAKEMEKHHHHEIKKELIELMEVAKQCECSYYEIKLKSIIDKL